MTMEANRSPTATINSLVDGRQASQAGLTAGPPTEMRPMSRDPSAPNESAEPNLTPLLDVVFQLITFFMLVINFSQRQLRPARAPARRRLGPAGRGRRDRATEDRLVLNIDSDGHLLIGGEVQPHNEAVKEIKHQADLVKLNLKAAGREARRRPAACRPRSSSGPTRTRRSRRSCSLIKACQTNGFRKFALKAMNGPDRRVRPRSVTSP